MADDERYRLESSHAWFRARQRLVIWAIRRYFPEAKHFLEIGIGTGVMLSGIASAFPGLTLYGADRISGNFSSIRRLLPQVGLIQLDAPALPFSASFNLIGAFDMLEHIEDDVGVLEGIHRALLPGGGVVITVPQHPFLWSKFDEYDGGGYGSHKRRYTRKELVTKVSKAGFDVVRVTSFISLLLPALIGARLLPSRNPITPLTGLHINPWLNTVMGRLLRLEYALIRNGINFPAGGSLLLVAKKTGQSQAEHES